METNTEVIHLCDYRVILSFSVNFIASPVLINLNKWIYSKQVISSYALVVIHFLVTFLFLILCIFVRIFKFKSIGILKVIPLAIIFCGFVVLTNLSLQYNTVGTSQIIKTMTTPCIILIQYVFYNKATCIKQQLTMIPIVIGVFFNSYYDVKFSVLGVTYASTGVVVASVYQVLVGEKQKELKVNSMQLLLHQAPLSAVIMLFLITVTVPLDIVQTSWREWSTETVGLVLLSGILAWLVNMSVYWIIRNTSPVTCVFIQFLTSVVLLNATNALILSAFDGIYSVFTFRAPAAHHETTVHLISHYFFMGYKYKEILVALLVVHGIRLSLRHLKRLLRTLNLLRMTPESMIDDTVRAILQELSGSGKCIGYKTMWKRLKLKYGLNGHRSTVLRLMWIADPAGMERRKRRRLLRRQYSCPGPNFVWHIDGYDKIKPFGFAIHGVIDGFSRRIMWLAV